VKLRNHTTIDQKSNKTRFFLGGGCLADITNRHSRGAIGSGVYYGRVPDRHGKKSVMIHHHQNVFLFYLSDKILLNREIMDSVNSIGKVLIERLLQSKNTN
jgi:hypothetical protein